MFERPSQRRQSSSGEGRPHICASCSALAFASPLKVTDESIILRLSPANKEASSSIKVKDYVRMLTNKEIHLSAGKYVVLASDRTNKGDLAAPKLGQVQYALAKVASIFPQEVLADFKFRLVLQGSEIELPSRHLLFIKGLMESYGQSIIQTKRSAKSGKESKEQEINMSLGTAIRYIQQDSPNLADYTLARLTNSAAQISLEKTRSNYWEKLRIIMKSNVQIEKRATLYRDVAALTGIAYAFVRFVKSSEKFNSLKSEEKDRELRKLIEEAEKGPNEFSYYTARYEDRNNLSARIYENPETHFIYKQAKWLLSETGIQDREKSEQGQSNYLVLSVDDLVAAYNYLRSSQGGYVQEKDWRELTYQLKLSLYSRFPTLVRSKSDSQGE